MILQGNQRAGGRDLANHLLKDENEHIEIYEIRGFVADDLHGAFHEAYAISKGTQAKQYLYSLSLNPPADATVSTQDFQDAIAKVEDKLNLTNQPRAIVFHEKQGRRHCHVVWSRIKADEMKAVHLPHSKRKLMEISRELYIQHGWQMPAGMIDRTKRSALNMSFAEWQQARRLNQNPRVIKQAFQGAWATSDNRAAFARALKERGLILAHGDRRGFVALDHHCNVFAVSKWVGLKAKEIRAKLGNPDQLPSTAEAKAQIAGGMIRHLESLKQKQNSNISARKACLDQQKSDLVKRHKQERQVFFAQQAVRRGEELLQRQARFRKGFSGLWDRLTGRHKALVVQNRLETERAALRDRREKDDLIFKQLAQRRKIAKRTERIEAYAHRRDQGLSQDVQQYQDIKTNKRDAFDVKTNSHNHGLER